MRQKFVILKELGQQQFGKLLWNLADTLYYELYWNLLSVNPTTITGAPLLMKTYVNNE